VLNWQLIDKFNKACVFVCTTPAAAVVQMYENKQTFQGCKGNVVIPEHIFVFTASVILDQQTVIFFLGSLFN